jgi:hypothetical protein
MGETPTPVPDRYAGLDLVVGKIGTFGGRLEELAATGIVAAFGLDPVEDAPRRAAHAAMAILRAAQRARAEGEAVDIRLAIHVGEVVVGQASGTAEMALESKQESWALLGALVAQAEPNSIVVSEAAVQFLEPRFDLLPGEAGPALPGRTYRLVGLEPSALEPRRRLARFVGRARELELVQSQFAAAGRGHGQVVGIVGEAGIGKTRLVTEFRQALGSDGVCLEPTASRTEPRSHIFPSSTSCGPPAGSRTATRPRRSPPRCASGWPPRASRALPAPPISSTCWG